MAVAEHMSGAPYPDGRDDTLNPGDRLLHGQYRIDSYLNSGGFGITYLAHDSLDRKVVIKECFPSAMCCRTESRVRARSRSLQKDFEKVVRHFGLEARRMSKLKHPNIVGVHQVFEDFGTSYMALDFVEGRDLQDIIEQDRHQLTPADIKQMLLKLLDAIQYVHEQDVLHRDISPDNILIDQTGNPVLIDFGAAREVATNASRALSALHIVKDGYSPQEFYLANNTQSASSDLYSLGATFYHLITGEAPPNSQVRLAALAADELDPYKPIPPRTEGYDHYFLRAIDKALAVFPKDRLQSAEEWIEEIDQARRQKAMRERARKDQELDLAIRELTATTNRELMATSEKPVPSETKPIDAVQPVVQSKPAKPAQSGRIPAAGDVNPEEELAETEKFVPLAESEAAFAEIDETLPERPQSFFARLFSRSEKRRASRDRNAESQSRRAPQ
ncbi:serine/threonine-protein kinase [Pseudoruegeria sp. HB172150]|uniref:serine/threonine-protein kinase n=1 Tax=Pseudoruegeria sp. HB172150 TaxID=2721164 RepID=UPI001552E861|nr:serine/threonine-protein kinase [Pseudoruegeria sp. HB172150]